MVGHEIVCCMCGDVGFTDKLFRCINCHHRFQHSYCSNLYGELSEIEECNWCQTKDKTSAGSKKLAVTVAINRRSGCSGEKIWKQHHRDEKRKSPVPSPRQATRRYKLLKDVMC